MVEQTKNLPKKSLDEIKVSFKAGGDIDVTLTPGIVRKYLVSGKSELVTDQEIVYFLKICQARRLNPFIKDAYLIKYSQGDPAAIVTSIDFYRKRARAQKDCVGWQSGVILLGKDKEKPIYRTGELILEGETLVGGWAEATPEGWKVPCRIEVNLKAYLRYKQDGGLTKFWEEAKQPGMVAKVAEAQLLRRAWPDEFQGVMSEEEVGVESMGEGAIDITPPKPFEEQVKEKWGPNVPTEFAIFLSETAKAQKPPVTVDELKVNAADKFDEICQVFEQWKKTHKASPKTEGEHPTEAEVEADLKNAGMTGEKQTDLNLKGKK